MTHGHLRFYFAYRFEDYTYNDEKSGAAERNYVEKTTGHDVEDKRETSDNTKDERSHQNNLVENLRDVLSGGSAGTNAGDGAALLHKVVGNLNRIERNGNVEISECNDQSEEQDCIDNAVGGERLVEEVFLLYACKLHDRDRKRNDRARKDDRHNAGHIELDRKSGALTAVLLSADGTLCVLNGDSSFCVRHVGNEDKRTDDNENNGNPKNDLEPNGNNLTAKDEGVVRTLDLEILVELNEHGRQTGYDVCKQDYGNTVTNALLVDLFAEPHNKASARGVACDDDEHGEPFSEAFRVENESAVDTGHSLGAEDCVVTVCRDNGDTDGYVASDLFDLSSALFACLGKSFKGRESNRKQLNDDRSVDVRLNRECEQRRRGECITRQDVQVGENTVAEHVSGLLQSSVVDKGNRQSCADTI